MPPVLLVVMTAKTIPERDYFNAAALDYTRKGINLAQYVDILPERV